MRTRNHLVVASLCSLTIAVIALIITFGVRTALADEYPCYTCLPGVYATCKLPGECVTGDDYYCNNDPPISGNCDEPIHCDNVCVINLGVPCDPQRNCNSGNFRLNNGYTIPCGNTYAVCIDEPA